MLLSNTVLVKTPAVDPLHLRRRLVVVCRFFIPRSGFLCRQPNVGGSDGGEMTGARLRAGARAVQSEANSIQARDVPFLQKKGESFCRPSRRLTEYSFQPLLDPSTPALLAQGN